MDDASKTKLLEDLEAAAEAFRVAQQKLAAAIAVSDACSPNARRKIASLESVANWSAVQADNIQAAVAYVKDRI